MPIRKKRDWIKHPKRRVSLDHNGLMIYVKRYLSRCEVSHVSQDTLKRRDSALHRFVAWCDERGIHDPKSITKPMLERYQRHLFYYRKENGEPLAVNSQHVMLTPIKSFFKWLTKENYLLYNPASELELPKKHRKLPRHILTLDEIELILNIPDVGTANGLRDRAILETLYATGIRRMELANLSVFDVDLHRCTLLVRGGKGGKDRYVPLGKRAAHWITLYQQRARPLLVAVQDDGALFLMDYGERFSRDLLSGLVKKIMRYAHVEATGSCHLFRHAFATHLLENGADIRFIQAMLGHEDLSTTEIYTHVSIQQLTDIHAAAHPLKLERQ